MWRWLIRVLVVLYLVLSMAACQMTMTAARSIGLETVDWVLGLAVFLICALQWQIREISLLQITLTLRAANHGGPS